MEEQSRREYLPLSVDFQRITQGGTGLPVPHFYCLREIMSRILYLLFLLAISISSSSCIVVGWSSSGGGFIWPGGLLFLIVVVIFIWIMRRR